MAKAKSVYVCSECGYETQRWLGRCPGCEAWNTLQEQAVAQPTPALKKSVTLHAPSRLAPRLGEVLEQGQERVTTGSSEFDRVLGGGIVPGSMLLVGGDPGVGKSTLLLQISAHLCAQDKRVLYISGEESERQIKMRAKRLGLAMSDVWVISETAMDEIEAQILALTPDYVVIDSIQTVYRPEMTSAPGSVSQVRECTALLMRYAKRAGCAVFLVGHVTKEGALAGPRVLEHMVDAVLYFEGDRHHNHRILRAVKNRFGSTGELGIFEMRESGMVDVPNPSALLLSERALAPGSVVSCMIEGTRPLLIDIQALVCTTVYGNPRRQASGVDLGRLALLLAVLEKRVGLKLFNQDTYINIAGGMELDEPAGDLPLCAAIASSLGGTPVGREWAVFGEVGLSGEVRSVGQLERRMNECLRQGFTHCVVPNSGLKHAVKPEGLTVYGVQSVSEALRILLGIGGT